MTILITRRLYETLPEGVPLELCDGALVRQPSPRYGHQLVQSRILRALHALCGTDPVAAGPVDVLVDELNVFVPDIVLLADVPEPDAQYVGVPRLVFEILSPATRERDRDCKTRRYLGLGVREVWLIDPQDGSIEVVDLDGGRVVHGETAARSGVIASLELVPARLFAPPGA